MQETVSVIIVGAGPTGIAAANLLGQAGIDTLILECNVSLSNYPKAISLDDEGLRICQAMGLIDTIIENILLDIGAHYLSAGRFLAQVAPTSRKNGYPLISTFHQPKFEATLLQGLNRFVCVTIRFQHTVEGFEQSDSSVIVAVRTPTGTLQKIECAYLLACDGAKSAIRHALNIPMQRASLQLPILPAYKGNRPADKAQKWLVVDCIADEHPSAAATFFCNPRRPAVTVPAPHNGRRWEFMLLPGESEQKMLQTEKIVTLIQQYGGSQHPHILRQAVYTFHALLARNFAQGRVFLLGDAAHLMPPFGGQGMNSGLRDAHNLCWKLALVLQKLAHPRMLESYQQERHEHVNQMILFSAFLGSVVMPTNRTVASLRDFAFRTLNIIPAFRELLTEARIKPQPKYKQGFLLRDGSPESKALTGLMLPQPEVISAQGQRLLLDDLLGPGFAVLRCHHNPPEAFASLKAEIWQRLEVRFVGLEPPKLAGPGLHATIQASDFPFNRNDLFIVLRPDRYILDVFKEEQANTFASALERLLQ